MHSIPDGPGQGMAQQPGDRTVQPDSNQQDPKHTHFWEDLARTEGWGVGRCLGCHATLCNCPTHRCSRCGRTFDPANPQTMNMGSAPSAWLRFLVKLGLRRAWD